MNHQHLLLSLAASTFAVGASCAFGQTYVLKNPKTFDLRMPKDFFRARLPQNPELSTCHTQGIEIVSERIFVSCILYDPLKKFERTRAARGYLLSQSLKDIERPTSRSTLEWTESDLINQALSQLEPGTRDIVAAHPSGLVYDPWFKKLWLAAAVYNPNSFSRLLLIDPELEDSHTARSFQDHIGTLALFESRRLLFGATWDSVNWLIYNLREDSVRKISNRLVEKVDYQDCSALNPNEVLCGGNLKGPLSDTSLSATSMTATSIRYGRLHLLTLSDKLELSIASVVQLTAKDGTLTKDLGQRRYVYQAGRGDVDDQENWYGDYASHATLTNNGFALSQDRKHAYFLPDDLPNAKLIRYELTMTPYVPTSSP